MNQSKSIGPFKAMGMALHTVTTTVGAVDNAVSRTSNILDKGFNAIDTLIDGSLADLDTDNIVEDAHRKVRIHKANKEAADIMAKIDTDKE